MAILKFVLNVLSPEVAGDTDNIPGGTVQTQRQRGTRARTPEEGDEAVKRAKFHEGVMSSLKNIGDGLLSANIIAKEALMNQAIVTTREAIRCDENKMQEFKLKCISCTEDERKIYQDLMVHHGGRIAEYEEELKGLLSGKSVGQVADNVI